MQRFRLTPTEKRVAAFILAAFMLGLVTKCYRDAHPLRAPSRSYRGAATRIHKQYETQSKWLNLLTRIATIERISLCARMNCRLLSQNWNLQLSRSVPLPFCKSE
jgi:hypothetical protein